MAYKWIIRATPMASGHAYVRPAKIDLETRESVEEPHDWSMDGRHRYPKLEWQMRNAIKACQEYCDLMNGEIDNDGAKRGAIREMIKEIQETHPGEIEICEDVD